MEITGWMAAQQSNDIAAALFAFLQDHTKRSRANETKNRLIADDYAARCAAHSVSK